MAWSVLLSGGRALDSWVAGVDCCCELGGSRYRNAENYALIRKSNIPSYCHFLNVKFVLLLSSILNSNWSQSYLKYKLPVHCASACFLKKNSNIIIPYMPPS